jgi:hypothetical protein
MRMAATTLLITHAAAEPGPARCHAGESIVQGSVCMPVPDAKTCKVTRCRGRHEITGYLPMSIVAPLSARSGWRTQAASREPQDSLKVERGSRSAATKRAGVG